MIPELSSAVEVIPNRLYWIALPQPPAADFYRHYFSIDQEFVYEPFFYDFGPLNLVHTYRYCQLVQTLLQRHRTVVHFTSMDNEKRSNAGYLMCAYQVICLRRSADDAFRIFNSVKPFLPFRDASCGVCHYECSIIDCIRGIEYAIQLGWFDISTFDHASYEYYEKIEQGDMTWIVPHKFLAFASPSPESVDADGFSCMMPTDFVPIFKSANIGMVIRLNKKTYDRKLFVKNGIKHVDMYYLDGSCPSREVIGKFLSVAASEPRAIAVHCKAGLGRTGTLIGLYCMKYFSFPARAFIGWCRICRPGSILGPQQLFLSEMQHEMFQAGAALRMSPVRLRLNNDNGRCAASPSTEQPVARGQTTIGGAPAILGKPITTLSETQRKFFEKSGDHGQGERLLSAKRVNVNLQSVRCLSRNGENKILGPHQSALCVRI